MFKGKMDTPGIPERVFALCKIVENEKTITLQDLKERMEPSYLNQTTSYFGEYKTAAEELDLIKIEDNTVSLLAAPAVIENIFEMRKYINGRLEYYADGQFYKVTKQFYDLGDKVFQLGTNVATWGKELSELTGTSVDEKAMRGWRFWVPFLGLGYRHEMFVIPNACNFILDLVNKSELEENQLYSFNDFISALRPYCNIVIPGDITNRTLNYGVSAGLRTLHDNKIIKLEHIMDQEAWSIYPMPGHSIEDTVTSVSILRRNK